MVAKPQAKHHSRRHSWPPLRLSNFHHKKDINDDPFSFFISPSDDSATFIFDHMNADIEPETRSRSLSPSMIHNKGKILKSPTMTKLRKWVEKMEARYLHTRRSSTSKVPSLLITPPESPMTGIKRPASPEPLEPVIEMDYAPVSPPLRGRRSHRTARRPYGNRMVRSHSKRARVWREPGEDIWPVMEDDAEDIGLGISI